MTNSTTAAPQARLFVGMGGSGLKTIGHFVSMLTQHSQETRKSEVYTAYLLVDTDGGDLAEYEKEIRAAYKHVHREPVIRTVHLSADITDFASFVETKLGKGEHDERLKEVWWYRQDVPNEPFTAINLKDSPTKGAGQCPLVSTFLAWNQMRQIEATIDDLLNSLKNRSVQGENLQNWTLEVSLIAGLAGGTGRGCWHLIASKIREKLRDLNLRPKPVGFFFDSSVLAEDVKRSEQVTKLKVNSLTGTSELLAWLRNEYDRDTDIEPFQFRLPSLEHPRIPSSDLIDTTKLNTTVDGQVLRAVSGRAPISAAYLIFGSGKQGTLGDANAYYRSVAIALYARLFNNTASKNINEAGHLNGLAAATISVPIAGVQEFVRNYVREFLPVQFAQPLEDSALERVTQAFLAGIEVPETPIPPSGDPVASNVPQRVYHKIGESTNDAKQNLEEHLSARNYEEAETAAKELAAWPDEHKEDIRSFVREVLVSQIWGEQTSPSIAGVGGTLRNVFSLRPTIDNKSRFDSLYGDSDTKTLCNPVAEAVRDLLRQPFVKLQTGGREEVIDLSSYGTKRMLANRIAKRLGAIVTRISEQAMPDNASDSQGAIASPDAKLAKARTGFLKTNVSQREKEEILNSVHQWIVLESNEAVRETLKRSLDAAANEVTSLERALAAVVDRLATEATDQEAKTRRCRENSFWDDNDFQKLLDGDSAFDQATLSNQILRPREKKAELTTEFYRLMKDASPVGFIEARKQFVTLVQDWINSNSISANAELDRKLPDIVHESLAKMADQFMVPDKFYEDNFGFFQTVKGLMKEWGAWMIKRMGSPQDKAKLASVFKNQFGIEYPDSAAGKGVPKQLDTDTELTDLAKKACAAMAVRLGGRCDPLFQQRFDEGERPTYDAVAVALPTEAGFDEVFAKDVEKEAENNPQFMASGNFTAYATVGKLDAGNPYTMFAYATQQFEDWRDDAGVARIASLEYYKSPEVLNWLRACEDPSGASVFLDSKALERFGIKSCRDIYGLGFISPLFVHNKTLRELRWSPWDESKARSADKKTERLDLLAFALLEVPPEKYAPHFIAVLKKAKWPQMPLLAQRATASEDVSNAWSYTRPAMRLCKEVTREKHRDTNHPAFTTNHGHRSIRRCFEELLENENIASAVAGEAYIFLDEVLCNEEYADDFDARQEIRTAFRYLGDRLAEAKAKQDGPAAEKMKRLIDELIARVTELGNYSPEKLKEHFEKIRRNCELQTRA
jgi:hypothetical protein